MCRLYGQTHNTQWACKERNMPLCCTARQGRELACYRKHKESKDINDGCAGVYLDKFIVPAKNLRYGRQSSKPKWKDKRGDNDERVEGQHGSESEEENDEDEEDNDSNDDNDNNNEDEENRYGASLGGTKTS